MLRIPAGAYLLTLFLAAIFFASGSVSVGQSASVPGNPAANTSKEPWFKHQAAYFSSLGVLETWSLADGRGVKVGIIDTGFDYAHPDLKERIIKGYSHPGVQHPRDMRTLAHGTFIASIIGADPANGKGMSGLCPRCEMIGAEMGMIEHWPIKFRTEYFKKHPKASDSDYQTEIASYSAEQKVFEQRWLKFVSETVAGSIRALTDRGCGVIVMALMLSGLSGEDLARVENAMAYAAAKDAVIIMGAGNGAEFIGSYPGPSAHTLIVGSLDRAGARWEQVADNYGKKIKLGSNFGPRLDIMAPCQDIVVANPHDPSSYSTTNGPRGPYEVKFSGEYEIYPDGGTSISVAFAGALAALVRSARPELSGPDVLDLIRSGAGDMAKPGRDDQTGWGAINFMKTIKISRGPELK